MLAALENGATPKKPGKDPDSRDNAVQAGRRAQDTHERGYHVPRVGRRLTFLAAGQASTTPNTPDVIFDLLRSCFCHPPPSPLRALLPLLPLHPHLDTTHNTHYRCHSNELEAEAPQPNKLLYPRPGEQLIYASLTARKVERSSVFAPTLFNTWRKYARSCSRGFRSLGREPRRQYSTLEARKETDDRRILRCAPAAHPSAHEARRRLCYRAANVGIALHLRIARTRS